MTLSRKTRLLWGVLASGVGVAFSILATALGGEVLCESTVSLGLPGSVALALVTHSAAGFSSLGMALLLSILLPASGERPMAALLFLLVGASVGVVLCALGIGLIREGYATPSEGNLLINSGGLLPVISLINLAVALKDARESPSLSGAEHSKGGT